MQSKYCYKGTDILKNKIDIHDQSLIDKLEADITRVKLAKLNMKPIKGNFDLKHLEKIHKFIFGDIYNFAGKIREENISKGFVFASCEFVEPEGNKLLKNLKQEKYLKGLNVNEFSDKAAYYMSELNVLHPFREGNGRSTREFIRELAGNAGYELDWSKISKEQLFNASVRSVVDPGELSKCIQNCIVNKEPLKEISKLFEMDKGIDR